MWKSAGSKGDLKRFSEASTVYSGVYRADVYANDTWAGRTDVTIRAGQHGAAVKICLSRELFEMLAIEREKLASEIRADIDGLAAGTATCIDLAGLADGVTAAFDNGEMRLDVSIPQMLRMRRARDYVDPRLWDDGVTATTLQYDANVFHSMSYRQRVTQAYAGIRAGMNVGPWRFRHRGSVSSDSVGGSRYQAMEVYASRAMPSWKSTLVLGDGYTNGTLFDSFAFRGVRLASDERMYPLSERGYAPVVRGAARGNAVVRIRQAGAVIYEANVPAGPFEITDLYPTGYGGDIEVEVIEADGSQRISRVPYAAPVNALRAGSQRHGITIGQYRALDGYSPWVFEGTFTRGLSNTFTGYVGLTASAGYLGGMVGTAINTRWGAIGFDATHAQTSLPGGETRTGQSFRVSYSKFFSELNTQVMLAAYRYSTNGFLNLHDAVRLRDARFRSESDFMAGGRRRGRLQLTLNQRLPWGATLGFTGATENYWNRHGHDTQFQFGYHHSIRSVTYGVSVSRQYAPRSGGWDTRVMADFSVPLGRDRGMRTSTSFMKDSRGAVSVQQSLSGVLGDASQTTYGVNVSAGREGAAGAVVTEVGGHLVHGARGATVSVNASVGDRYRQVGVGVSGGVVAYGGGVVFAPTMGETVAVIEADKAAGARVQGGAGSRIGNNGRALASGLTPFANNAIEIDPTGLPMSVEFDSTTERAIPTAGAVVRVTFGTKGGGRSAIVRTRLPNNRPVPFGAAVLDSAGQQVGAVSQGGRVLLKQADAFGEYWLKWGEGTAQECRLAVRWPIDASVELATGWIQADGTCDPEGATAGRARHVETSVE